MLFDIIEVVPDPNNPQTDHKFKLICSSEEKTPVTAMCEANGYLAVASGPKVVFYEFDNGKLNGIAFLDVHMVLIFLWLVCYNLVSS